MTPFPDPLEDRDASPAPSWIGAGLNRVDGPAKVSGTAKYAAEYHAPGMLYGVIVPSAIARGRIASIDATAALALPGVVEIFTHENRPRLAWFDGRWKDEDAPWGSPLRPLDTDRIQHSQQPIALVVAETFEQARHAASLVAVRYAPEPHETALSDHLDRARDPHPGKDGWEPPPKPRGRPDAALAEAPVRIAATYTMAAEHHNPMEMFATTVFALPDGKFTVHDKTQGVLNVQTFIHKVFGLATDDFKVLSPYMGGGFGSGLRPQHQLFLAVLAATELKRSVQVGMTRPQMWSFGHRPATVQRLELGAERDGTLTAIVHECDSETSRFEDYVENVVNWSASLYQCENVRLGYRCVPLDVFTPLDMRAPGAASGVQALESAVDELAWALRMDPLAFRRKNYAEQDQVTGKPFSSKALRACYDEGAARFGWARRPLEPGSLRDGSLRLGWGMATGVWDAMQQEASARAELHAHGTLLIATAASDIGTGTYTILTQIAADTLGLAPEAVRVHLADSSLPPAPLQGGSWTAASVGTAVQAACERIAARLLALAHTSPQLEGTALAKAGRGDVVFSGGDLRLRADPTQRIALTALMQAANTAAIEETATTSPDTATQGKYTMSVHSAVFVEVAVDDRLGTVVVRRVVSAIAGGRILNEKTARSQIMGAVVWGLSMALYEESVMDPVTGRYANHDLAEYHMPVHADIPPAIDVIFVEEHDDVVNPLGVKGLGEIGIVGVAAAVSNAVFHATGRRVRELPITLDKVMAPAGG